MLHFISNLSLPCKFSLYIVNWTDVGISLINLCWSDQFQNMDEGSFFQFQREGTIRKWQVITRH